MAIENRIETIESSSVSWRAIFAGAFISMLCYSILMSLGIAIGSASLRGLIQGSNSGEALGVTSALWLVFSILISLFLGSYSAGRVSGLISMGVGRVQGVVIAALFFAVMLFQVGATIGSIGRGIGSTVGTLGGAAGDVSKNPKVQETIRNALGGLNLKSSPETVAQVLATRLLNGDQAGARDYLASQTGLSRVQADQKIQTFKTDLQNTLKNIGGTTAQVVSIASWTLFGSLILGSIASMLGGASGASVNISRTLGSARPDQRSIRGSKVA